MRTAPVTARAERARDTMPDDEYRAALRAALDYLDDPYALAHRRGVIGGQSVG